MHNLTCKLKDFKQIFGYHIIFGFFSQVFFFMFPLLSIYINLRCRYLKPESWTVLQEAAPSVLLGPLGSLDISADESSSGDSLLRSLGCTMRRRTRTPGPQPGPTSAAVEGVAGADEVLASGRFTSLPMVEEADDTLPRRSGKVSITISRNSSRAPTSFCSSCNCTTHTFSFVH